MTIGTITADFYILCHILAKNSFGFDKLAAAAELLSEKTLRNVPAIQWGREHELVAFQE